MRRPTRLRSRRLLAVVLAAVLWAAAGTYGQSAIVQFIFTSDAHYGITRPAFRGAAKVDARIVNGALVAAINSLPSLNLPNDGGLRHGQLVGSLDFLVEAGDIANRSEVVNGASVQSPGTSWKQFEHDYLDGLTVTDRSGHRAPIFIVPGNHDASNAVGFYRPMVPTVDKTPMVEIYNRMMTPAVAKTSATYVYDRDKVLTARDIGGIHLIFVTVWPDSIARAWMEHDLARVSRSTPVIIFAHDPPDAEARHFANPSGAHRITAEDRFENLLVDQFEDGERKFESFVLQHPNVSAYFHGHSNWNQFYDWTGPDHTIALHTFRVDSPMKGAQSAVDETRLSFQVVTIEMASRTMTVRECLWNTSPIHQAPPAWGSSTTVALQPRPPTPAASTMNAR
jgi:hypothetical protein